MKQLVRFLNGSAEVKRVLTNSAEQGSVLKGILGDQRYADLLKLDASPMVLELRSIATQNDGALSFKPKYDIEISRSDWAKFQNAWEGMPYTDAHTKPGGEPVVIGRILKSEVKRDGWYNFVYVLPSQDAYKNDVSAEALLFPDRIIRQNSTEFNLVTVANKVTAIEPVLIAEVMEPNVKGSGVVSLANVSQKGDGIMTREEFLAMLNSATPKDLEGTNVLTLLQNEQRLALAKDEKFRKEVIDSLTEAERKSVVNGVTDELLKNCDVTLTKAQAILNAKQTEEQTRVTNFRADVQRMYKDVTGAELTEVQASALINSLEWKPGMENQAKKYMETFHGIKNGQTSVLQAMVNAQKPAATNDGKGKDDGAPQSKPQGTLMTVVNAIGSVLPQKKG